ncbi:glycoside hydrolase family 43 protein [Duganella callida]|uniref:Glycoside hydrolase family 43 protein n=2 Tax=Duganella callida TaxID=2561932 RepID=A0A4Y9S7K1_9BURK|nr:glycoside hydrolase family 43 protein [Duganella callida]
MSLRTAASAFSTLSTLSAFSALVGITSLAAPAHAAEAKQPASYSNPVLSGFHADPSICRVGGDYYLATSSFEYFPGVPIFHSKDLVHWRQIGHALTLASQLNLTHTRSSQGIYAPTLRCHDGVFYMVTTNMEGGGAFYVHTRDPAGEWSEPVWLNDPAFAMDPSLFFDDDGKVYYTRHGGGEHGGVYQAEIDLKAGKLLEQPRLVWSGTGGVWPEGPHLYKHDGQYYLLISEGGTSYNHSLTMARSPSPMGPYTAYAGNPVITHRGHPELPLQAIGHGDLVQTPEGKWWMPLLGIRPVEQKHHLGRETMLTPVAWNKDGWLTVNSGQPLALEMSGAGLPPAAPWPAQPVRDEFDAPRLALHWTQLRGPGDGLWSLSECAGHLRLKGSSVTMNDIAQPAFIARRQEHMRMRAATQLEFQPAAASEAAGLVLRQNEKNYYELRITGAPRRRLELVERVQGVTTLKGSAELPAGPVVLQVESWPDHYVFSFGSGSGPFKPVGSLPTAPLSSEAAGGFTGVFIGMYAEGAKPRQAMPAADFAWFDYQPVEK